jgi:effector-binding domain-containing protein
MDAAICGAVLVKGFEVIASLSVARARQTSILFHFTRAIQVEYRAEMAYDVHIEEVTTAQPLAIVKRTARKQDLPRVVPDACGTVWRILKAAQAQEMGRHVAVYLDGEINMEIGVEMPRAFPGVGEVIGSSLPTGLVASTVHYGPYPQLHEAHDAIRGYCKHAGYEFAGPSWEIYGHWQDEWNNDPSKIRTDVYYLLKR